MWDGERLFGIHHVDRPNDKAAPIPKEQPGASGSTDGPGAPLRIGLIEQPFDVVVGPDGLGVLKVGPSWVGCCCDRHLAAVRPCEVLLPPWVWQ